MTTSFREVSELDSLSRAAKSKEKWRRRFSAHKDC